MSRTAGSLQALLEAGARCLHLFLGSKKVTLHTVQLGESPLLSVLAGKRKSVRKTCSGFTGQTCTRKGFGQQCEIVRQTQLRAQPTETIQPFAKLRKSNFNLALSGCRPTRQYICHCQVIGESMPPAKFHRLSPAFKRRPGLILKGMKHRRIVQRNCLAEWTAQRAGACNCVLDMVPSAISVAAVPRDVAKIRAAEKLDIWTGKQCQHWFQSAFVFAHGSIQMRK